MDKKSRSQRNPAVKDLTSRNTNDVKAGSIDKAGSVLLKACATGAHFKEVTTTI